MNSRCLPFACKAGSTAERRGEERPDALIGAGVARQQMSSRLGGGLPVEEGERESKRKVEVEKDGVRLSYNRHIQWAVSEYSKPTNISTFTVCVQFNGDANDLPD